MIIADGLTPLHYINLRRPFPKQIKDTYRHARHELMFVDRKSGGLIRISAAFSALWAIHAVCTSLPGTMSPAGTYYSYTSGALCYWTGITYGMNLIKDIISNDLHPREWSLSQANTADAAQATVFSLFSILVLQYTDHHLASRFSAFPRFLTLAGANALWLAATCLIRGKDRATIVFNMFRSVIGGIVAAPLSIPLSCLGMTDTVLQSKTSSELVGGIGEGTIRYLRGVRMRKTRDIVDLVERLIRTGAAQEEHTKELLDIIRIWAKVPFGKGALKRTLLAPHISYHQAEQFFSAFNDRKHIHSFIRRNTEGYRKPGNIRVLYDRTILPFNRWGLKLLLRKNAQEKRLQDALMKEKEMYERRAKELLTLADNDLQHTMEHLAWKDVRSATLLMLCIAKYDQDRYRKVLKEWDPRCKELRNKIVELIKGN